MDKTSGCSRRASTFYSTATKQFHFVGLPGFFARLIDEARELEVLSVKVM